jgi:hypothetical protein
MDNLSKILTSRMIVSDEDMNDMIHEVIRYTESRPKYQKMWQDNYPELSFEGFIYFKFSALIHSLQPVMLDIKFKLDNGVLYGAS